MSKVLATAASQNGAAHALYCHVAANYSAAMRSSSTPSLSICLFWELRASSFPAGFSIMSKSCRGKCASESFGIRAYPEVSAKETGLQLMCEWISQAQTALASISSELLSESHLGVPCIFLRATGNEWRLLEIIHFLSLPCIPNLYQPRTKPRHSLGHSRCRKELGWRPACQPRR